MEKSIKEMNLKEIEDQIKIYESQDLTTDGAKLYLELLKEAEKKRKLSGRKNEN